MTDYCLVLSGDYESRPFVAAALFRKGFIRRDIWLTRVAGDKPAPNGLDSPAAARRILTTLGIPDGRITALRGDCASTFDEAKSLQRMLATRPDATVAVVTSDYHTRRSRWVFRQVLGAAADRLEFVSVPTDYYNADDWWQVEEGFATYSKEFLKLPFYYIRYGWGLAWIALAAIVLAGAWWIRGAVRRSRARRSSRPLEFTL